LVTKKLGGVPEIPEESLKLLAQCSQYLFGDFTASSVGIV